MPRAIWTGILQFVLISFPVKLYKATDDKGVSFKNLHTVCGSNINLKKWCNTCGKEVLATEINKGYEIGKGQYVTFTEDEIENVLPESAKIIKIEAAIPGEEIPVITYDTSYFMAPDKGGEHVYNLLFNSLALKGKVLIGRVVMRSKEHLVAIRPYQDGLLLSMLHFVEEVRDIHEVLVIKEKQIDKKELDLAVSLVDYLTGAFNTIDQKDKFRNYIETMAEMKATGQVITIAPIKPVAETKNIIEGLQKSIEMVVGAKGASIEMRPDLEKPIITGVKPVAEPETILKIPEGLGKVAIKEQGKTGIKEELDKMYGVTEEEINKMILDQKIESEQERLNILRDLTQYKSFEDYVKTHPKEFEGIEVSYDFRLITISDDIYPRINLPLLKKMGIVADHFRILIYIKTSKKEITGRKIDSLFKP